MFDQVEMFNDNSEQPVELRALDVTEPAALGLLATSALGIGALHRHRSSVRTRARRRI